MPFKIFVGNIAAGSDENDLRAMFESFGQVTECDIVSNYAFVHMASEDEANSAIESLHQSTFNGVQIRCELSTKGTQGRKRAREAEEDGGFGGGDSRDRRGGRGGGRGGRGGRGGGDRGGRGRGGRGGGLDRGGRDRFNPYSAREESSLGERRLNLDREALSRDPFRDPYIREILLRDPYVRDLIEKELYYRDVLTRDYDGDSLGLDSYARTSYKEAAPLARDPYARPPPEFYSRSSLSASQDILAGTEGLGQSGNGLADYLSQSLGGARQAPRPVPPPSQDDRFNAYDLLGGPGSLGGARRGGLM